MVWQTKYLIFKNYLASGSGGFVNGVQDFCHDKGLLRFYDQLALAFNCIEPDLAFDVVGIDLLAREQIDAACGNVGLHIDHPVADNGV